MISHIRKLVVDFTDPYMDTNLAILLHKNSTIRSTEDLVASNYSYGTLDMGWNKAIMMSSKKEPYATMWSKMASADPTWFVHDNEEGVLRVLEEEFGYILRKPMAEYFTKKDCRLYYVEMVLGNEGYGFALPKQSSRQGEFNAIFRNLQREGKLEEIKQKWWYARPCPYPQFANSGSQVKVTVVMLLWTLLLRLSL